MSGMKRTSGKVDEEKEKGSGSVTKTPEKGHERGDGHYSTPKKSKLGFNFWKQLNQEPVEEASTSSIARASLMELVPGQYLNKSVTVRVTYKSEKKDRSIGKMFEFHAMDATGEFAFLCYPNTIDIFFEKIRVNASIRVDGFIVKSENKDYPTGTGQPNMIVLSPNSIVSGLEDDESLPAIPFTFEDLLDLQKTAVGQKFDTIGVVVEIWEVEQTKNLLTKRDIAITDKTKESAMITLWGTAAENFSGKAFGAIAIRKGYVSEFRGIKSLNCRNDTLIWVNPTLNVTKQLEDWFASETKGACGIPEKSD